MENWGTNILESMNDHSGEYMMRERYSKRADGVPSNDWKTRFRSCQRAQRQQNPFFNAWWVFIPLLNHFEFEALQLYDTWFQDHNDELNQVKD